MYNAFYIPITKAECHCGVVNSTGVVFPPTEDKHLTLNTTITFPHLGLVTNVSSFQLLAETMHGGDLPIYTEPGLWFLRKR